MTVPPTRATTKRTPTRSPPATRSRRRGLTFADVVAAARRLPGVEEGTSYGTPALKVKGKFLLRLKEDGDSVAIRVPMEDRDVLLALAPHVFFITDHYRGYPAVLFRLGEIDRDQLHDLLDLAWRFVAPKRLAQSVATPPRSRQAPPRGGREWLDDEDIDG